MFSGKPASSPVRPSRLRRLDYVPAWLAIGLGIGSGALVGGGLAFASPLVAGAGFVALLSMAAALAFSGEPITVVEPAGRGATERRAEEAEAVAPPETPVEPEPAPPEPEPAVKVVMVSIPAGVFLMGSPDDEEGRSGAEGPVHEVRISAFECMRYPVTRRLYKELMGEDPGWPEGEADERPVNNVSWRDAIQFCNRLSEREGLTPCYRIEAERQASWDLAANGYRLLTEAEWEYACRAGTQTRYSFGDDDKELGRYAWYADNSDNRPQPVGTKESNPWGLYDMHGNVWEWCWDWYGPYSTEPQRNPIGSPSGDGRVLRGGAFVYPTWFLRSAIRGRFGPEDRLDVIGFRCARGPRRQP